jgi:hypothetical protein
MLKLYRYYSTTNRKNIFTVIFFIRAVATVLLSSIFLVVTYAHVGLNYWPTVRQVDLQYTVYCFYNSGACLFPASGSSSTLLRRSTINW